MSIGLDHLWQELAVCVRRAADGLAGDWEILTEGPLARVVDEIKDMHSDHIGRLKISLPDRRVPPVTFIGSEIRDLVRVRQQLRAPGWSHPSTPR